MFNIFKNHPPEKHVKGLGDFRYTKDGIDEYWELISELRDSNNSIEIDFCTINGNTAGAYESAENTVIALLKNPTALWALVDEEFLSSAKEDIPELTKERIKEYYFIKTLTVSDSGSYEIGFHSKDKDIFLELFVREGSVTEIHKDYGCCA